jgi:hypothetical protein
LTSAICHPALLVASRILIVGWFSLPEGGATAGDLAACETVCQWLDDAGWKYDVALGTPFEGGVDWRSVAPHDYSHVVHVCGPVGRELAVADLLPRFASSGLIAVDVSMVEDPEAWNPFDSVIARDGAGPPRPALAFTAPGREVPVVGVIRARTQPPVHPDGRTEAVDAAINALMLRHDAAFLAIDTRLDINSGGLRTPDEVEALIARTDAVVTSRLHGLVFALRRGVPALAIDPVPGGAKVSAQAQAVGWEQVLTAAELAPERLDAMLDACLSAPAREAAASCAAGTAPALEAIRTELLEALGAPRRLPSAHRLRRRLTSRL